MWLKEAPDGEFYATGFIEGLSGDILFKVVKNLNRLKDSHAPYVLIRKDPQDEEPRQYLSDL